MPRLKLVRWIDKKIPLKPSIYSSQIRPIYAAIRKYDINKFNIDTNALETIYIDPSDIVMNTGRSWKPWDNRHRLVGKVMDGNWHSCKPKGVPQRVQPYPKLFKKLPEYKSFKSHFKEGVEWKETPLYERWMTVLQSNDETMYASPSDIKARFEKMDELFSNIKKRGYKSQLELATKKTSYLDAVLGEVSIDIGPEGQPLFVDGRHRLCMAKILDIEEIPVIILVRHRRWITNVEKQDGKEKSLL